MRVGICIAIVIYLHLCLECPLAAQETAPLTIACTGRLLGYLQGVDPDAEQCIDGLKSRIEPPEQDGGASSIPCTLETKRKSGAVVLGMGDNFAPAYWSRFTRRYDEPKEPTNADPGAKVSESPLERYRINHTTEPQLDAAGRFVNDGVALFLQRAGYDAIVPGKEDFYFGAYHLMLVARLLKATLRLTTTVVNLIFYSWATTCS